VPHGLHRRVVVIATLVVGLTCRFTGGWDRCGSGCPGCRANYRATWFGSLVFVLFTAFLRGACAFAFYRFWPTVLWFCRRLPRRTRILPGLPRCIFRFSGYALLPHACHMGSPHCLPALWFSGVAAGYLSHCALPLRAARFAPTTTSRHATLHDPHPPVCPLLPPRFAFCHLTMVNAYFPHPFCCAHLPAVATHPFTSLSRAGYLDATAYTQVTAGGSIVRYWLVYGY